MKTIIGSRVTISYSVAGSGPPLVLVHGAFSDYQSNWTFVAALLQQQFTLYSIASPMAPTARCPRFGGSHTGQEARIV
jgi:pimeloyl-ACP methyl ester carboxylesterase